MPAHPDAPSMRYWTLVAQDPGVYLLNIEALDRRKAYTNCFAVCDDGEWLVIDSELHSAEGASHMLDALGELSSDPRSISFFLTHAHSDHAGLIAEVSQESEVYLGFAEFPFVGQGAWNALERRYADRARLEGFTGQDGSCFVELHDRMVPCLAPSCKLHPLFDGDVIEIGSRRFTAVLTPGHSPGHLALFEEATGYLFSGDLVLPDVSPFIDVSPGGSDSWLDYLISLQRVRTMPVRAFFQSHGDLGFRGMEKIDWLIEHHLKRLDEVVEIVAQAGEVTGYEVVRSISWSVKAPAWEDIPLATRGFMLCEGASILEHLVRQDRLSWRLAGDGAYRYFV